MPRSWEFPLGFFILFWCEGGIQDFVRQLYCVPTSSSGRDPQTVLKYVPFPEARFFFCPCPILQTSGMSNLNLHPFPPSPKPTNTFQLPPITTPQKTHILEPGKEMPLATPCVPFLF